MPDLPKPSVSSRFRLTTPNLIAFSSGVCALWLCPRLPSLWWLAIAVLAVIIATQWLPVWVRPAVLFALAGFIWGDLNAAKELAKRLPPSLEGATLVATGRIDGLPERDADGWRFRFCPEQAEHDGEKVALAGCWHLTWRARRYQRDREPDVDVDDALPVLEPGAQWRLTVRLRRPRGLVNPGGFDSERRALEFGTTALGHVRSAPGNIRLSPAAGIDALRDRISSRIDTALTDDHRMAALLKGLAVGDRRGFRDVDWQTFRSTGTTHLFSISGLHVGMIAMVVAGFMAVMTGMLAWPFRHAPRRVWATLPAVAAAIGYAALAGFEVPTQRSLAMIAFAGLALVSRRGMGLWQGWSLALAVVLVLDPLAMLGIGFWLSYGGVAWLLLSGQGRFFQSWWSMAVRTQCVVTLGLLPLGMAWFGQVSWLGAPVNLIAIPWITYGVVPLSLLSLPFMWTAPALADGLIRIAADILDPLMRALDIVAVWPVAVSATAEHERWTIAFGCLAIAVALTPLRMRQKWFVLPLLLPLAMPMRSPGHGQAELHILDVGQGTAVIVRTRTHALLFDAGARVPEGFDAGETVVLPALNALGIAGLDMLIVSHADNDHSGGASSVVLGMPVRRVVLGEFLDGIAGESCREGMRWTWDGVAFEFLHPPVIYPVAGNDRSCVLKIVASGASALLTGDAGTVAEMRMIALHADRLPSDVLLLGHHGSNTSTGASFLAVVKPTLAVATAGYRNRFGHPDARVLRRLAHHGIVVDQTSRSGALRIRLGRNGIERQAMREHRRRFWHEP